MRNINYENITIALKTTMMNTVSGPFTFVVL